MHGGGSRQQLPTPALLARPAERPCSPEGPRRCQLGGQQAQARVGQRCQVAPLSQLHGLGHWKRGAIAGSALGGLRSQCMQAPLQQWPFKHSSHLLQQAGTQARTCTVEMSSATSAPAAAACR